MKILIVDDNREFVNLIEEYFKINKLCSLDKAYNGEEAISMLSKNNLDIILLDMDMPAKNGYDVMRYLKEKDYDVQVIITSSAPDKYKLNNIGYKNFGYLPKPFFIKDLLKRIQLLIYKGSQ